MNIPVLGTLVEVDLREAWNHEAYSFTPWLAVHLDALAAKIGIPLELEGREVPVDTFSADILARNPQDDSLVLIENQLEGSDHSHLGQIMTYLAGLNAHTVVWVAANFRDAHLSALKWLNENTDDSFAFFAVQVKAVRIGDSPIAPMFEVLTQPNQWERKLQSIAKDSRQLLRFSKPFLKAFWAHYVERFEFEKEKTDWTDWKDDGLPSLYRVLHDLDRAGIKLVIVMHVCHQHVSVFVRGSDKVRTEDVYDLLAPYEFQLKERTGAALRSSSRNSLLFAKREGNTTEKGNWDVLMDWIHDTANQYESALREIFEGEN